MNIEQTLQQRGNVHGDYVEASVFSDTVAQRMAETPNWNTMLPHQRRALNVIVDKVSRILHGSSQFQDHWHDIIGYARLVEKDLEPHAVEQVKETPEHILKRMV